MTKPLKFLILEKVMPYPPAVSGDAVYSRGMIEALAERAMVTVLCADNGSAHPGSPLVEWYISEPERTGRKGSLFSRWPLIVWKGAQSSYHACLDELLLRQWDVIVVDNIGTAHALPKLLAYRDRNPDCSLVHFSHEHEFNARKAKYGAYRLGIVGRCAMQWDLAKVKWVESMLLKNVNIVTVLNSDDAYLYRRAAPEQCFLLQTPGYDGVFAAPRVIDASTPRRVLLFGGRRSAQKQQVLLDWLEAGHGILSESGIETQVVGDIPESLRQKLSLDYPDLAVLGFVDDPASLIAQARAGLIVDTLGGGFKLRLLDHVFNRLPIIGLSNAIEGLPVEDSRGFLSAHDYAGLAQLVIDSIDDFACLNSIMNAAFDACCGKFDWETRAVRLISAVGGTSPAASPKSNCLTLEMGEVE